MLPSPKRRLRVATTRPAARLARTSRVALVALAAMVATAALAVPSAVSAAQQPSTESLGVTPAEVTLPDSQRGETYVRQVSIQNEFDTPTHVTLELGGETGGWATTSPAHSLTVAAREHVDVQVRVEVPSDAANGAHAGFLRVVADAKQQPDGSGFALRYAVAVPLNVTVGGEQVVRMRWDSVHAENVETGTPPALVASAVNEGNVRTVARVRADVLPFSSDTVLASAEGAVEVLPGERAQLRVAFDAPLPEGQYRVRVHAEPDGGAEARIVAFKVLPPGSLSKDGFLRYIEHEPRVQPGQPVKLSAVFENTGKAPIGRAKLLAEVYVDGVLVAVVESDPRVVGVGERVNLTAFYTPATGGVHRIVGHVSYDGFDAMPTESLIAVEAAPAATGSPSLAPLALGAAGAAAALLAHQLVRRRLRRGGGGGGGQS